MPSTFVTRHTCWQLEGCVVHAADCFFYYLSRSLGLSASLKNWCPMREGCTGRVSRFHGFGGRPRQADDSAYVQYEVSQRAN